MFYEEKIIAGHLHFRTLPTGDWKPVSVVELSTRVRNAERRLYQTELALKGLLEWSAHLPKAANEELTIAFELLK